MFAESKARVAQQEEEEKARFEARQARSVVRTRSAERHRVAVVKQRSAELATKKVVQAEVREKAATLYTERLQFFAEHVSHVVFRVPQAVPASRSCPPIDNTCPGAPSQKAAKEQKAQRHLRVVEMERKAKFQIHREVESKQQAYAAEHRRVTDDIVRELASEAYERNLQQERARAIREEELEAVRQRWRYQNRRQIKERKDSIERFRRTGKLDPSLSANLGGDALADDIRSSMLTPAARAAMESMVSKYTGRANRQSENVRMAAEKAGLPKESKGAERPTTTAGAEAAMEAWAPASAMPRQKSPPQNRRPQSAGSVQSTGAPQWRPPRPHSAAPASNSIAARMRRPQSADSYSMQRAGTIRPRVSMLV